MEQSRNTSQAASPGMPSTDPVSGSPSPNAASRRAFQSSSTRFPTWGAVLQGPSPIGRWQRGARVAVQDHDLAGPRHRSTSSGRASSTAARRASTSSGLGSFALGQPPDGIGGVRRRCSRDVPGADRAPALRPSAARGRPGGDSAGSGSDAFRTREDHAGSGARVPPEGGIEAFGGCADDGLAWLRTVIDTHPRVIDVDGALFVPLRPSHGVPCAHQRLGRVAQKGRQKDIRRCGKKNSTDKLDNLPVGVSALTKNGGQQMIAPVHRDTGARSACVFFCQRRECFPGET